MIRPEGFRGVAFGDASDGDARQDPGARSRISASLGISDRWAWLRQVHGAGVAAVTGPGDGGEADAAFTVVPGLPIAVSTADCLPVMLEGDGAVGVAHAGWRGAAAGVVRAVRRAMENAGVPPSRAAIGPGIGPCCFEVGSEVADRFPGHASETGWGTLSVDLPAAVAADLEGLRIWMSRDCTRGDDRFHSYRRDGTSARQVAIAWLPA
ncbi:MAG TPA: polyphenol oxidase family protein [Acidimicrobiia bacterium]|nr:polyphenol oxidase family protein [Acidimicrobiia bacterium]